MRSRSVLVALFALAAVTACSRASETPQPKALPDPARDAAIEASVADAGATKAPPASPFTIVVRAPTALTIEHARSVGTAMALVQRLPGGGLVVASEFARARADGPGPLSVELIGGGMEVDVLSRPHMTQGMEGFRWVWSDAALAVVVAENETSRTGPRLTSYKVSATGFQVLRPNVGYWSAAVRDGSVLALERTAYEVPNSSMYPKGSGYEQNEWQLKPARVAVLSGKAVAPLIPAGVCPTAMSAAPDGSVVVTVEKCAVSNESAVGVLRFAPSATQAKLEWFPAQKTDGTTPDDVVTFAASAREIYVADGVHLRTWNGKDWDTTEPFRNEKLRSISRSPSGALWAVVGERVVERSADGKTWSGVPLPDAPADPLDEEAFTPPTFDAPHFMRVKELPEEFSLRSKGSSSAVSAYSVDATGEDVLVLAAVDHEAFVLSTKPRTPIARLPSIPAQRARLARGLKRRVAASPKDCDTRSFLVFPDTTTEAALRAALGAGDGGASSAKLGEGIVEGQKRVLVYGDHEGVIAATKRLTALGPKRLCGPAVVDREL